MTALLEPLADRTYRHLFLAQCLSIVGSGLTTVALALLAYELAGGEAGVVLGTALAIKMVAYVGVAPVVGALAHLLPRRRFLVTLDLVRAGFVALLPFVDAVWQVYALVFLFQSCSAAFTPTFQATIPDVLTDERRYTQALSLARLAYDLESLLSPTIAALLLAVASFHVLFVGNALAFVASALLVLSVALPSTTAVARAGGWVARTTYGMRVYLRTPRLRGLLAFSFAVAAASAMVIVNTVVYAKGVLGGDDRTVAHLMMATGGGSMAAALLLPRLLERASDRTVMQVGTLLLLLGMASFAFGPSFDAALAVWALLGVGMAAAQTPSGRLLRRSARPEDRPAIFAAQFALSHACWLVTYPAAGWIGASHGLSAAAWTACAAVLVAWGAAIALWPASDPEVLQHTHEAMAHEHEHVHDEHHRHEHEGWEGPEPHSHPHRHGVVRHRHAFTIDDHHPRWPG